MLVLCWNESKIRGLLQAEQLLGVSSCYRSLCMPGAWASGEQYLGEPRLRTFAQGSGRSVEAAEGAWWRTTGWAQGCNFGRRHGALEGLLPKRHDGVRPSQAKSVLLVLFDLAFCSSWCRNTDEVNWYSLSVRRRWQRIRDACQQLPVEELPWWTGWPRIRNCREDNESDSSCRSAKAPVEEQLLRRALVSASEARRATWQRKHLVRKKVRLVTWSCKQCSRAYRKQLVFLRSTRITASGLRVEAWQYSRQQASTTGKFVMWQDTKTRPAWTATPSQLRKIAKRWQLRST